MKTILVTGGAGFIGSNFVRYILRHNSHCSVVVLDKLTYAGNMDNLTDVHKEPNFHFVKGDICDGSVVDEVVSESNVIVNFAAETHVDKSIQNSPVFVKTNVYGTNVLLQSALNHSVEKFIHISTDEVYGSREAGSFTEADALNPTNPYSASKAAADLLALSFHKTYGAPITITRSSNVFGPYQYPEKFIPLFVTNALDDKRLPLYGDGLNVRDWLYVEDLCEAISSIMHCGGIGEIYNIGAAHERRNVEIAYDVVDLLKKDRDLITFIPDRPAHDKRYSLNCSKIHALDWQPRHTFREALKKTITWYIDNVWWWRAIREKQKSFREYYEQQYPSLLSR